jgi:predicted nucleotide-binding protein
MVNHHKPGDVLMRQGAPDNHLLLILSGDVSVQINGREVAHRTAGNHVGEMALVDILARRSASVIALEPTVTLQLSEPRFTALAKNYPELWRRIAVEIASRLRERSRTIRAPNSEPVIFIGSSSEALTIANEVHRQLDLKPVVARIWTDGVFRASQTAIESLVSLSASADFACLVLSADDLTVSRGKRTESPRDNVTFELGLLIGALGRDRVFLLKPKKVDIRIPSDLLGVTCLEYARGGPVPIGKRLRSACRAVWQQVQALGCR